MMLVMTQMDRRRLGAVLAAMFGGYLLAVIFLGLAAGTGANRLAAAAIGALSLGMSVSAFLRIWLLILNPDGRNKWWMQASYAGRIARIIALGLRLCTVCYARYLSAAVALGKPLWPRLV